MNRIDLLDQLKRFGFRAHSVKDTRIMVDGVGLMTEKEALDFCERRSKTYCSGCGKKLDEDDE